MAGLALPLLMGLPACGVRGLSFIADDRVSIVSPKDRATVELPMRVKWEVEDFRVSGRTGRVEKDTGYFAVFVDRAPQPPGRTVESLAAGDSACEVDPACPDEAYFASRGVYTTSETELIIDFIPDLAQGDNRDLHELTVVLLNGKGERIGESAFRVEFEVGRKRGSR